MTNTKEKCNALTLLDIYKVPYIIPGPTPLGESVPPTFHDGFLRFNFSDPSLNAAIEHTCHEIAHFLLAQDRRHLSNFGLGTDPGGGGHSDLVLTKNEASDEESAACLLGLVLLHRHNHDCSHHFKEYGIDTFEDNSLFRAANMIENRVQISAHFCESVWAYWMEKAMNA